MHQEAAAFTCDSAEEVRFRLGKVSAGLGRKFYSSGVSKWVSGSNEVGI